MKLKQWFYSLSLKKKIGMMTLFTAIIPLIIFTIICGILFNNSIRVRSEQEIQENLVVVSERIDSYISGAVLCSNNLTINLSAIESDLTLRPFNRDNLILSYLNRSLLIHDGIDSICYLSTDGKMYSTDYGLYSNESDIVHSPYYRKLIDVKNGKTILFDRLSDCMQRSEDTPVITLGKHITQIGTGKSIGYLFINVTLSHLEQTAQNEITQYVLFDSRNERITQFLEDDTEELLHDYSYTNEEKTISKRKGSHSFLITNKRITDSNWTLVGITNLSIYNISTLQLLRTLIISGAILFVLLIFVSNALTALLTRPLEKLVDGAEAIKSGDLSVRFEFESEDEIGKTGEALNAMTIEIANLIDRIDEEAKKKRAYELALIQEQVKPHFLYNTLDIIIVLNEMNKTREATRVTHKLANYYKNSLSSSAEFIPLRKEFDIIEDYLDLQLMRYQDQFNYNTSLPSELNDILVPKMTLQPLVENALYHGLKYKEDWGTITVTASTSETHLILTVSDNGIGMTKDTLAKAKALSEKPEEHFGVYSVSHRLQLYYGSDYSFDIQSVFYEGTTVTISIPLKGEAPC